jgi:hypothetical protein
MQQLNTIRRELENGLLDELLARQDRTCAICREPFEEYKPTADHDHQTGVIRGLLCKRCNAGLGMFRDSVTMLGAAIIYLETTAMPERESHRAYMEEYNRLKWRNKLNDRGALASPPSPTDPIFPDAIVESHTEVDIVLRLPTVVDITDKELDRLADHYTDLYVRLGLEEYLPKFLERLKARECHPITYAREDLKS